MNFMDVVLEAKKKQPSKPEPEENEEDDEVPEEDDAPEDFTQEDPDDEPEQDEAGDPDDLPDDDGEPEDLADDDTVESEEEEEVGGDDLPAEDGEPEDLATDTDGEPTDGDTEGGDAGDPSMDDTSTEETLEDGDTPREKRLLQEDYIDLYFKTKDFILKLNSLDKSNTILNQVIIQIDKNLTRLKTSLWDYVSYDYAKNEYVTNLYRYNQFIEVFKTNLEMLSSSRDFILKNQEEEESKVERKKTKK